MDIPSWILKSFIVKSVWLAMRYAGLWFAIIVVHLCLSGQLVGQTSQKVPSLWSRSTGSDWPRMLGPTANGHSNETGILTDWSDGKLSVAWSLPTGVGYGNAVTSHGRLYQFDRFEADRGMSVERLSCHRAETGELLWTWEAPVEYQDMYGYNNGPRASPVVDEDRVYVFGVAGNLACIDAVTGEERWRVDTAREYGVVQNFFGVGSTPCIFQDLLLVMIGGSPPTAGALPPGMLRQVPTNGTAIVAFDKYRGREVYRVGDYLASYSAPIIAEMRGKPWCVTLVREGLLVFDPKTGKDDVFFPWRASMLESVNAAWPVVIGDQIFISETYEIGSVLLDFDGTSLKPVWTDPRLQRNQAMRAHWATPVYLDGFLFGCSGRNEPDADLRVVRWKDGEVQWVHRNRDRTTSLAVDGHLIVLGEQGLLQLIRGTSSRFELVTELDLGSISAPDGSPWLLPPTWAPPVLSHGLLYLRGAHRIVCLRLIP